MDNGDIEIASYYMLNWTYKIYPFIGMEGIKGMNASSDKEIW